MNRTAGRDLQRTASQGGHLGIHFFLYLTDGTETFSQWGTTDVQSEPIWRLSFQLEPLSFLTKAQRLCLGFYVLVFKNDFRIKNSSQWKSHLAASLQHLNRRLSKMPSGDAYPGVITHPGERDGQRHSPGAARTLPVPKGPSVSGKRQVRQVY